MKIDNKKWYDDHLQFARLLSEIQATEAIHREFFEEIAKEMDIHEFELHDLFDRAQVTWEALKDKHREDQPYVTVSATEEGDRLVDYVGDQVGSDIMRFQFTSEGLTIDSVTGGVVEASCFYSYQDIEEQTQ